MHLSSPGATEALLRQKEKENKELECKWDALSLSLENEVGKELAEEILKEFGYFSLKDELVKTHLLNAENNEM